MKNYLNVAKQLCKMFVLLYATSFILTAASYAADSKKVVMVVSGYGQDHGKTTPGYEFDEFAKAYIVFSDNGIEIDVASPQGGQVVADKYDPSKPYNAKVLSNTKAMNKLNNTLATNELNPKDYDAIFIVGGKGAMFDLPNDNALKTTIADIYQRNGTVAAVCHGPAALVDVKLDDGSYLIANKVINSFTNKEEKLFSKKWISKFEFLLEDKLIERGAQFESSDLMLSHVSVDERLITGQNPVSTVDVATTLVKGLGLSPVDSVLYSEDRTMKVIAKLLEGDTSAEQELLHASEKYQIPLVGQYGYFYQKTAKTNQQFEHALTLMTLAQEAVNNPMLDMQIAKTQHTLGNEDDAKATLNKLLMSKPDYQPALDMLQTAF